MPMRYWLLERFDAEDDPPDRILAVLPWDLLDRAVESVATGLGPGGEVGELIEIQHWLTRPCMG
jgi:hypothetical protein